MASKSEFLYQAPQDMSLDGQDILISIDVPRPRGVPAPLSDEIEIPVGILYPKDEWDQLPAYDYPDRPPDPDEIERRIDYYGQGIVFSEAAVEAIT
ncbi:MAG: hypothetical protein HYV40_00580 [Candidatus Levybacteria bacterium]|nr:hypothetical protein [Candidatus Levybacteria bacterium]